MNGLGLRMFLPVRALDVTYIALAPPHAKRSTKDKRRVPLLLSEGLGVTCEQKRDTLYNELAPRMFPAPRQSDVTRVNTRSQ